jgi:hypothetical protein
MNNDLAPWTDTTGGTGFHSLSIPPGDTGRPYLGAFSMTSCITPEVDRHPLARILP